MPLTNAARDLIAGGLTGGAIAPAFNNANAHIGVGDSAAAFTAAQTDLQAATNKLRRPMEPGYPATAANVLTFRSVFGTGDANWPWNEWAVFNAAAAGVMLNRRQEALGTKTNLQTWTFTVTLTVTAA